MPESYLEQQNPNPQEFASDVDGALFGERSGFGRTSNVFLQSTWSWNLNGMYQVAPERPYGINIAASVYGREGYPVTYYWAFNARDGLGAQNLSILDGELDRFRTDRVFTADLRLEKELATSSNLGFTFSIEIFNLFNSSIVMQRERAGRCGHLRLAGSNAGTPHLATRS